MKSIIKFSAVLLTFWSSNLIHAQEIKTLLDSNGVKSSGAYGAITNKFTRIGGEFANMSGIYGGWYVNHKFMIGIAGAAVTNHVPVSSKLSSVPGTLMSYEYGQFGLMTEYVLGSNKVFHLGFQLFSGAGFNAQYNRYGFRHNNDDDFDNYRNATDWFFVTEPGVNLEVNVLKWMRFCPGVSYRMAFGEGYYAGLKGEDISSPTINLALKFGKF